MPELARIGQETLKNLNLNKVFVTTDGSVFAEENDAKNHVKNLEDKHIEVVTNSDEIEDIEENDSDPTKKLNDE